MRDFENVDLEHVAELCPFHVNGPGERMNTAAVDAAVFRHGHAGTYLAAAGIDTFEMHGVAGRDPESRWQGAVPSGVGGFGGEKVLGHSNLHLDRHLQFYQRVTWQSGNANGGSHMPARFAENLYQQIGRAVDHPG